MHPGNGNIPGKSWQQQDLLLFKHKNDNLFTGIITVFKKKNHLIFIFCLFIYLFLLAIELNDL